MSEEDNVLFVKTDENEDDANDVWDDTVLIKAYDKAVNLAKEQVAKRLSLETSSNSGKAKKSTTSKQPMKNATLSKWTVGSPCRALYSVDGEEYEAIILKISNDNSGTGLVKFVGYGNTEKVYLSSLRESEGLESQIAQKKDAEAIKNAKVYSETEGPNFVHEPSSFKENGENMDYESEVPKNNRSNNSQPEPTPFFSTSFETAPPAPPLPPQLMARLPGNDEDALSSMLMSWYISGFHTGYYHGIKQAEKNSSRRKK